MSNHYETPEAVEMGRAQDVILGCKCGIEIDFETSEPTWDIALDEMDE